MAFARVTPGTEGCANKVGIYLRRAVFLDRDGVINLAILRDGKPYPPKNISELMLVSDAGPALMRLKQKGFLLIVITNQPEVARGLATRDDVDEIHAYLASRLPVDEILACYHDDADRCECRKPLPGLIFQAAKKHGIDLQRSYVIGDRWRDIDAGAAAGCRTILIDQGYVERGPSTAPNIRVSSLHEAVDQILKTVQTT